MKKLNKSLLIVSVMVVIMAATTITGFAASKYGSLTEAVVGITGKTTESVMEERASGKTYGTIAKEAGKLEGFKKESLEIKKDKLNAKVQSGTITKEQADKVIATITERQANCDGEGQGLGQGLGLGQGNGKGQGLGLGQGNGKGQGLGNGLGQGNGTGVCNGTGPCQNINQ